MLHAPGLVLDQGPPIDGIKLHSERTARSRTDSPVSGATSDLAAMAAPGLGNLVNFDRTSPVLAARQIERWIFLESDTEINL
jgi:hypothetical protein